MNLDSLQNRGHRKQLNALPGLRTCGLLHFANAFEGLPGELYETYETLRYLQRLTEAAFRTARGS